MAKEPKLLETFIPQTTTKDEKQHVEHLMIKSVCACIRPSILVHIYIIFFLFLKKKLFFLNIYIYFIL
jgi:hypothetical protein